MPFTLVSGRPCRAAEEKRALEERTRSAREWHERESERLREAAAEQAALQKRVRDMEAAIAAEKARKEDAMTRVRPMETTLQPRSVDVSKRGYVELIAIAPLKYVTCAHS